MILISSLLVNPEESNPIWSATTYDLMLEIPCDDHVNLSLFSAGERGGEHSRFAFVEVSQGVIHGEGRRI
jgi:hypothetical protein